MALPVWFQGLRVEAGVHADLPLPLTARVQQEAHFMSVFRVISQGATHTLLASGTFTVAEDEEAYHADSMLLPNHDFRAFTAPLWQET